MEKRLAQICLLMSLGERKDRGLARSVSELCWSKMHQRFLVCDVRPAGRLLGEELFHLYLWSDSDKGPHLDLILQMTSIIASPTTQGHWTNVCKHERLKVGTKTGFYDWRFMRMEGQSTYGSSLYGRML